MGYYETVVCRVEYTWVADIHGRGCVIRHSHAERKDKLLPLLAALYALNNGYKVGLDLSTEDT